MPHGDFSDYAGFMCFGIGAVSLFAPHLAFQKFGALEAAFDSAPTTELICALRLIGAFCIGWGVMLYSNRWNTVSGKVGAIYCLLGAGTIVYNQLSSLDNYEFKMRPQYLVVALFVLASLHLSFNANPMHTWQSLKAHEEKKKAAKTKSAN